MNTQALKAKATAYFEHTARARELREEIEAAMSQDDVRELFTAAGSITWHAARSASMIVDTAALKRAGLFDQFSKPKAGAAAGYTFTPSKSR